MSSPATASTNTPAPAGSSRLVRLIVVVLVLLATAVALALVLPWFSYRMDNIVVREAAVRGVITRIGARIEGRVRHLDVEPGQRVFQGQVLLRLEDGHLQAALGRARGELDSTLREVESEKLAIEQSRRHLTLEIERAKGAVRKAAGELEAQKSFHARLEKQFERTASLVKNGAAASAELDQITGERDRASALVQAAAGALEAAQFYRDKAIAELEGIAVRRNRLGVLEARVAIARAQLAAAEADADAAIIRAPEDGRILDRIVNVGGSAKVGEPLIAMWIGRPWVEAWADERDLRHIRAHSRVDISIDADPARRLAGRVESIGLATDKQLQPALVPATLHAVIRRNAMVPIRIALDDEYAPVQLGLSVLVGIRKAGRSAPEDFAGRPPPNTAQEAAEVSAFAQEPGPK